MSADHSGLLHEYIDGPSGEVLDARTVEPAAFELDWGDGSAPEGGEGGEWSCATTTPLRPVDLQQDFSHVYDRPGRYTVTLRVTSCLPGELVRRVRVDVR